MDGVHDNGEKERESMQIYDLEQEFRYIVMDSIKQI